MSKVNYTLTADSVAIFDGQNRIYLKGTPEYDSVRAAILSGDESALHDHLYGLKEKIEKVYEGFRVDDDIVYINDDALPPLLGKKLKALADAGESYKHVLNFWELLKQNPSYQSIQACFDFIEKNNIPFYHDESGMLAPFKAVTSDYLDKYSRTVKYEIGSTVEMPRNKVNDDTRQLCSTGFHVGGPTYVSGFWNEGDHILQVLVSPADFVSIPNTDQGGEKARVCKLVVLREVTREEMFQDKLVTNIPQEEADNEDDWDCEDDFDDEDEDLDDDMVDIDVLIDGEFVTTMEFKDNATHSTVEEEVKWDWEVNPVLEGKKIIKTIFVPNTSINFITEKIADDTDY